MTTDQPVEPSIVDLGALRGWMDDRGLGHGKPDSVAPLAGGTQNLLLTFERAGRTMATWLPSSIGSSPNWVIR